MYCGFRINQISDMIQELEATKSVFIINEDYVEVEESYYNDNLPSKKYDGILHIYDYDGDEVVACINHVTIEQIVLWAISYDEEKNGGSIFDSFEEFLLWNENVNKENYEFWERNDYW